MGQEGLLSRSPYFPSSLYFGRNCPKQLTSKGKMIVFQRNRLKQMFWPDCDGDTPASHPQAPENSLLLGARLLPPETETFQQRLCF